MMRRLKRTQMDQMMNTKKTKMRLKMRLKMTTRLWTKMKPSRKLKMEKMPKQQAANGSTKTTKMPRKVKRKHHLLPPKNINQLRTMIKRQKRKNRVISKKIRKSMRLKATVTALKPMANPRPLPKMNKIWVLKIVVLQSRMTKIFPLKRWTRGEKVKRHFSRCTLC